MSVQRDILESAVNVGDHFIRVDLAPRHAMKISRGDLQTFKLLLRDRLGDGPHVSLTDLPTRRDHGRRSLFQNTRKQRQEL